MEELPFGDSDAATTTTTQPKQLVSSKECFLYDIPSDEEGFWLWTGYTK